MRKLMGGLLAALFICALAYGQNNVALLPPPKIQFFDANGNPLAGGKIYTYAAGTSTPLATYSESTGTTLNANPVVLDSGGFGSIFLLSGVSYKIVVRNSASVVLYTQDGVSQWLGTAIYPPLNCANYSGSDGGAKLQACHDAAVDGQTLDARGFTAAQTAASRVNISKSLLIQFSGVAWTTAAADQGQTTGSLLNITADNVTIEGVGPATVLKKSGALNQQALISSSTKKRITIRNLKIDGDEASYTTQSSKYFTCWVSAAASADLRLENVEVTACGHRAIDWRGTARSWVVNNYIHDTGIATVGGSPLNGNSVSIDVDGTTHSTDATCTGNVVAQHGDSFKCGNDHITVSGNWIYGRAFFGNTAMTTESGIDALGTYDGTISDNHLIEIRGVALGVDGFATGAETLAPKDVRITNNVFYNVTSLAAGDPRVQISQGGESVQLNRISFTGNSMTGTRLAIGGIDGFTSSANTFFNIRSSAASYAVDIAQGAGGVMRNFSFVGDTFDTDNATLLTAFNVGAAVTAPGGALIQPVINYANVTTADVTFQSGAATDKVIVRTSRANTIQRASADATAPLLTFKKSRGSNSSPATIANSDVMQQLDVTAFDGTNWLTTGRMRWFANSSGVTAGTIPTRWDLYVMNGSASLTQALLVDNNADHYARNFYPLTGATYDLGLTGTRWRDGWFSRNLDAAGTITAAGQIISSLTTGTAPLSITSTTTVPNLTVSNHPKVFDCGTTTTCANTAKTSAIIVYGTVALSSGTPSTATLTSLPFTNSTSYVCTAVEQTSATGNLLKVANVSGASTVITGPATVTDVVNYICVGT